MPSNPYSNLECEVTFTPSPSGTVKKSYTDYGFYMLEPTYGTRKRKEILVDLPYMDGVLDFSAQFGTEYFAECEHTYRFVQQFQPTSAGCAAMWSTHETFESFCWNFHGAIHDDYGRSLGIARCTSFTATVSPGDNTLTIEVTFTGRRG